MGIESDLPAEEEALRTLIEMRNSQQAGQAGQAQAVEERRRQQQVQQQYHATASAALASNALPPPPARQARLVA